MCAAAVTPAVAICYGGPTAGGRETTVAATRPTQTRAGKRKPKHDAPSGTTPPKAPEHQFVDIDPWAVLLEQLMEMPEEEPVELKGTKAK